MSAVWEDIWAASAEKHGVVGEAHLFLGILDAKNDMVTALLMLSGVSGDAARLYAQSWLDNGPATAEQKMEWARDVARILMLASQEAQRDRSPFLEPHHFFIACVSHRRGAHLGQVLRPLGLDAAQLRGHLRRIRANQKPYPRGNPLNDLSESAKIALEAAHAEMRASFCGRIAAAHLLLGLLSDTQTADRLEQAGCDLEDLRKRARESIKSDGEIAGLQKRFSPGAKRALERAARAAKLAGRKRIDCGNLLIGLLPQEETLGEKWRSRGRELDSVDGLWTAEQTEVLRSTSSIQTPSYRNEMISTLKALRKADFIGFVFGFLWSNIVCGSNWWNPSAFDWVPPSPSMIGLLLIGFGIFMVFGIAACLALLLKRFRSVRWVWWKFYGCYLAGLIIGGNLPLLF